MTTEAQKQHIRVALAVLRLQPDLIAELTRADLIVIVETIRALRQQKLADPWMGRVMYDACQQLNMRKRALRERKFENNIQRLRERYHTGRTAQDAAPTHSVRNQYPLVHPNRNSWRASSMGPHQIPTGEVA